ncbi:MAG: hypothetical protein HC854_01850 [Flavobacterium sp.]|nr:hypothetical protein [Flavobacterium sp.]
MDDFANTASGNLNKLQHNNLFEIWESFAIETNILAGEMRARYIRDLTSLSTENIDVVKQMIAFRKQLYQAYTNLGLDFNEITKKNIAFAEI